MTTRTFNNYYSYVYTLQSYMYRTPYMLIQRGSEGMQAAAMEGRGPGSQGAVPVRPA